MGLIFSRAWSMVLPLVPLHRPCFITSVKFIIDDRTDILELLRLPVRVIEISYNFLGFRHQSNRFLLLSLRRLSIN